MSLSACSDLHGPSLWFCQGVYLVSLKADGFVADWICIRARSQITILHLFEDQNISPKNSFQAFSGSTRSNINHKTIMFASDNGSITHNQCLRLLIRNSSSGSHSLYPHTRSTPPPAPVQKPSKAQSPPPSCTLYPSYPYPVPPPQPPPKAALASDNVAGTVVFRNVISTRACLKTPLRASRYL